MTRYIKTPRLCLIMLLVGCWGTPSFAHPHVFVDCELTVIFDEDGLVGIQQRWVFDEMFSAFLLEDFDFNRDMMFDEDETQAVKQGAFDNLGEYEYFTHIVIDGEKFPVQEVTSYAVTLDEEGIASYQFFVPCPVKTDVESRRILISIFDDTYYTDVALLTDRITYQNPAQVVITKNVQELPELTYYYDQVIPKGLALTVAKQRPSLPSAQLASASEEQEALVEPNAGSGYPRLLQPVLAAIFGWQRTLKQSLTRFGKEIQAHPYKSPFWLFLLFAFVYGVIHALGPGHGKTIVVSYFLSHPGKYLHGVLMGNLLTFVHVFSAVIIVLLLRVVLNTVGGTSFETASQNLAKVSYSLLIFLGLFLLGKCVYEFKQGLPRKVNTKRPTNFEIKHLTLTALITGMVPCPGAALILVFAITQDIFAAGLLAMVCMAIGMGTTTSIFALLAIASRNTLFRLTARRQKLFVLSHAVLSMGGAVIITSIGALLLLGQG